MKIGRNNKATLCKRTSFISSVQSEFAEQVKKLLSLLNDDQSVSTAD